VPDGLRQLSVDAIEPGPFQPRRRFDDAELDGLAASLKRSGVMQPVVVRPRSDRFELVAGERRWRAAQRAGMRTIPALVRDIDDSTAAEWALVENVQRTDLNAIEKARALKGLIDRFGATQAEAADRVGLERSSVANLVRLLDLEPTLQEMIEEGLLSLGHGKALLGAAEGDRLRLAERCVREAWSVRRLEREASGSPGSAGSAGGGVGNGDGRGAAPPATATEVPEEVRDLERRLGEHLGSKVVIRPAKKPGTGTVTVSYFSLDHFDDLMTRIGYSSDA